MTRASALAAALRLERAMWIAIFVASDLAGIPARAIRRRVRVAGEIYDAWFVEGPRA